MANLNEFQIGLQQLINEGFLINILFDAIQQTEKVALSLQKSQLDEGRDNKGGLIGEYTKKTEELAKNERTRKPKIAGEPYNFQYTGGLFDKMVLLYEKPNVIFYSKDSKTELLVDTYQNLFGLDDYNLNNYLANSIAPTILLRIKSTLRLA